MGFFDTGWKNTVKPRLRQVNGDWGVVNGTRLTFFAFQQARSWTIFKNLYGRWPTKKELPNYERTQPGN